MSNLHRHSVYRDNAVWILPAGFFILAILAGIIISLEQLSVFIAPALLLIGLPFAYFSTANFADKNGRLLLFGWVVMLGATSIQHLTKIQLGYVLEFILFGMSIAIVAHLWRRTHTDPILRTLVFLWLLYLFVSIVSSFTGRSHTISALWQFQYNVKLPLMFGLGCMVVWGAPNNRRLKAITAYSWLLLGVAVAIEIVAPAMHEAAFGLRTDSNTNPLIGIGLRYRGPFNHAGYLALASATLAIFAFLFLLIERKRIWLIPLVSYILLTLLSGQRQETFSLALAILLCIVIQYRRMWHVIGAVGILLAATVLTSMSYLKELPMKEVLQQWGVIDSTSPLSERATLTYKGTAIALEYFPLGSGLGTYGGVGAQKYDQSMYLDWGFGNYWWFRQGKFLVDTYWPSIAAESGFFGAILLFAAFLMLWLTLIRRAIRSVDTNHYLIGLCAVGASTMLLLNTPTSLILTDPRGSIIFWYVIGAAWSALAPTFRARDMKST